MRKIAKSLAALRLAVALLQVKRFIFPNSSSGCDALFTYHLAKKQLKVRCTFRTKYLYRLCAIHTFYLLYLKILYATLLSSMIDRNEFHESERSNRREVDFLHAINAVAASLQSAVHSETAVFDAFSQQFTKLELYGSINLVDPTGEYMVVRAMAMPNPLYKGIKLLERMLHISFAGYRYERSRAGLDNKAMETEQTIFIPDNSEQFQSVMPSVARAATKIMTHHFSGHSAIIAPLFSDEGKAQGVLYAAGKNLEEYHVPAIAAFANHISIALQNAKLIQDAQRTKASLQRINSALAASRDAIHGLVQQIPVGIQVFDPNGMCVDVNEAHLDIFGVTRKQLVRQYNIFSDPLANRTGTQAAARRVLNGETIQLGDLDFDFSHADTPYAQASGKRTVNVTLFPVFDSNGQVVQFVGLNVDVTQRKKNEESLRTMTFELEQQKQMVDAMLVTTPDSFSFMDSNGRFLYASPRILQTTQLTLTQIVGKTWRKIGFSEELCQQLDTAYQQMLTTFKPTFIEFGYWRENDYREREYILSPLVDGLNELIAYVITSRDVTERKRELAAFQEAQKMESLGILAGGIAHDFNNLLVAMMGQTSLALKKLPEDNSARVNIQKALNAAQKAADLTRQMLAYSGRGKFEIRLLNLNQIIEENLHLFQVVVPKRAEFVLNLHANSPKVEADPGQMQQIVMNLLLNAVEALENEQGTITVSTSEITIDEDDLVLWNRANQLLQPGNFVRLQVKDNGIGMATETAQKIFDPFFTTKFTGRGLGLAAVLGIVRGHHGGIRVLSQHAEGTTFEIILPVSYKIESISEQDFLESHAKSGIVLVIDDEEAVRDAVHEILDSEGIDVLTAVTGQSGINIIKKQHNKICLVLLDLSMPGLSGPETLEQINLINPSVPVILISGYSETEAFSHFKNDHKLSGFIQKPFNLHKLIRTVYTYLPDSVDKP